MLSLEAITGVGIDSTEVRLRGAGVEASDDELRAGILLGGRATVRPIPLFDIYVQYVANLSGSSWTAIQDTVVGGELNLMRNISIFSGYRWWRYEEEFSSESDWKLDIRGPTAGVNLKF